MIIDCYFYRAEMNIVKINIDVLVKEGLGERAESDFLLARDTCLALMKLGTGKKVWFTEKHSVK